LAKSKEVIIEQDFDHLYQAVPNYSNNINIKWYTYGNTINKSKVELTKGFIYENTKRVSSLVMI
jgi:hypothetical protein